MLKKSGKFMADWRDSNGKRHRAAFPTKAEALAHQQRMRATRNPKKQPGLSRERLLSTSKRTPKTRTRQRHSGPSSKLMGPGTRTSSERATSKK
jgi:hypothetical protein